MYIAETRTQKERHVLQCNPRKPSEVPVSLASHEPSLKPVTSTFQSPLVAVAICSFRDILCNSLLFSVLGDRSSLGFSNSLLVGDGSSLGFRLLVGDGSSLGFRLLVGDGSSLGFRLLVGDGSSLGFSLLVGDGSSLGFSLLFSNSLLVGDGSSLSFSLLVGDSLGFSLLVGDSLGFSLLFSNSLLVGDGSGLDLGFGLILSDRFGFLLLIVAFGGRGRIVASGDGGWSTFLVVLGRSWVGVLWHGIGHRKHSQADHGDLATT